MACASGFRPTRGDASRLINSDSEYIPGLEEGADSDAVAGGTDAECVAVWFKAEASGDLHDAVDSSDEDDCDAE